jgi:predicted Fe-Mo cluster-binding NifX family protein
MRKNIMKIALPSRNNNIDDHFGHCEYFTVMTVDENKHITAEEIVQSPSGCGCKSNIVETLSHMGVTLMLAGNIGGGAVNVLNSRDIQVVRGCSGDVKTVAQEWLAGSVTDSGIVCRKHEQECQH